MRAVIQRVSAARVKVSSKEVASIGNGLLVLVGIKKGDDLDSVDYLARKIVGLRIFNDPEGKMNLSIKDPTIQGEILAVSQFTLLGNVSRGRRPSFIESEEPQRAESLFSRFVEAIRKLSVPIQTGVFGAMMEVSLVNEGPVTFVLDTENL